MCLLEKRFNKIIPNFEGPGISLLWKLFKIAYNISMSFVVNCKKTCASAVPMDQVLEMV